MPKGRAKRIRTEEVNIETFEEVQEVEKPVMVEVELTENGYLLPNGDYVTAGYVMNVIPSEAAKFVKTGKWIYK